MLIDSNKTQQLIEIQQKLTSSVMKTNIKGYKEYSREQLKIMKQMVQRIKVLKDHTETGFNEETQEATYIPPPEKYKICKNCH